MAAMLAATPHAGYAANCQAVRDNDLRTDVGAVRVLTGVIGGIGDLPNQQCPHDFTQLLKDFLAH